MARELQQGFTESLADLEARKKRLREHKAGLERRQTLLESENPMDRYRAQLPDLLKTGQAGSVFREAQDEYTRGRRMAAMDEQDRLSAAVRERLGAQTALENLGVEPTANPAAQLAGITTASGIRNAGKPGAKEKAEVLSSLIESGADTETARKATQQLLGEDDLPSGGLPGSVTGQQLQGRGTMTTADGTQFTIGGGGVTRTTAPQRSFQEYSGALKPRRQVEAPQISQTSPALEITRSTGKALRRKRLGSLADRHNESFMIPPKR